MTTVTKKELIDRIAEKSGNKRVIVKQIVQSFLDEIIDELGRGNRLEFRDFGVFESKYRAARIAQNPKTLERVHVPSKRTVKFKVGRLMKARLSRGVEQEAVQAGSVDLENQSSPSTQEAPEPSGEGQSAGQGSPEGSNW